MMAEKNEFSIKKKTLLFGVYEELRRRAVIYTISRK